MGVVIGSWPERPDLASCCNLVDLPVVAGAPLLGAVPQGAGAMAPGDFRRYAGSWLAPALGGSWNAADFTARMTAWPAGAGAH